MKEILYSKKTVFILFILLIFVEFALQTFWLKELSIYSHPILYFAFAISYLLFGLSFSKMDVNEYLVRFRIKININFVYVGTVLLIALIIVPLWLNYSEILLKYRIIPQESDIIPSIQTYVHRLLGGETVYKIIHFPDYDLTPDYVSLTWLPYVIAEVIGLDYRVFSLLLFFIFILLYSGFIIRKNKNNIFAYILPVIAFTFLYYLVLYGPSMFGRTLELTIAVFYMILATTIMSKNKLILVSGILLCLLSRYALSFWLVSYMLILLNDRGFKYFIILNSYILLGILLIFIPFISHDLNLFIDGLKYYSKSSINEWKFHGPHNPQDKPYTLSKGFGFAIYYYDYVSGTLRSKLQALQWTHLIVSIVSGLSVYVLFVINKLNIKDRKIFLVFGLKFFIMVFYVFIQIPYDYLYIVPLFLSISILGEMINKKKIVLEVN